MSQAYENARSMLDKLVYDPANVSTTSGDGPGAIVAVEQKALFKRLQSFTPTTWFGKPPGLAAVVCAAKGWRNSGPDMLTCDNCGAKVWCKLPANLVSDTAAGIIRGFEQQLTDAHDPACLSRSTSSNSKLPNLHLNLQLRFPILPSNRLTSSYYSRLQSLQQLQHTPQLAATVVPNLISAAQRLHPSLIRALATLLQLSVDALEQQATKAAAATAAPGDSAATAPSAEQLVFSKQQVTSLIALCGWEVEPLLPPHLSRTTTAVQSSAFAVSHLVPRREGAPSSSAAAAVASSSTADSSINAEHAVLRCELCGCKTGLWVLSRSGPYYMSQLASKAMGMLTAADAAYNNSSRDAAAAVVTDDPAILHSSTAAAAATPVAGDRVQGNHTAVTIAGGPMSAGDSPLRPSPQQCDNTAAAAAAAGVTSPEVIVSSLFNTIAGGSLLAAPSAAAAGVSGGGFATAAASPHSNAAPFGGTAVPAFGAAAAVTQPGSSGSGGGLFGLSASSPAAANVFGDSPIPAGAGRSSGPFGAAAAAASTSPAAAAVPVFGLGALKDAEQRTKRRRSAGEAANAAAAAGGSSGGQYGRSMTASPGPAGPPAAAAAAAGLRNDTDDKHQPAKQQKLDAAVTPGSATSGGVRSSFMKQPRLLASPVTAAAGCAADSMSTFDPIYHHRSWCPWVNWNNSVLYDVSAGHTASSSSSSTAAAAVPGSSPDSITAALAVGWSSTLLALQEKYEEQQLLSGSGQQQQQGGGDEGLMAGLLGMLPKPGQFGSTAALLAKSRQMMDALEG